MTGHSKTVVSGVALLTSLLLIFSNYHMWKNPIDITGKLPSRDTETTARSGEVALADTSLGTNANAREALDRPLFHPSRRPYLATTTPDVAEQPEPVQLPEQPFEVARPDLKLIGTRLFNGTRSALVQVNTGGDPVWLMVGDNIGGWRLGEITDTTLTLLNGQQSAVFGLYND